jgi:hypothetical protein
MQVFSRIYERLLQQDIVRFTQVCGLQCELLLDLQRCSAAVAAIAGLCWQTTAIYLTITVGSNLSMSIIGVGRGHTALGSRVAALQTHPMALHVHIPESLPTDTQARGHHNNQQQQQQQQQLMHCTAHCTAHHHTATHRLHSPYAHTVGLPA